jgi:dihydroflavonol-4-reductase
VRRDTRRLATNGDVIAVRGDLRRPGDLVDAMRGCPYMVHTAAVYSFTLTDRGDMEEVNVQGTRGLLQAAHIAGVERAVVTSSSAAVGAATNSVPATESQWGNSDDSASVYHRSKVLQERVALRAPLAVTTLLPTAPVGEGDHRPTPTGRMVLDVMQGRMWGTLGGGMNVVDVRDVARAHVLALERGQPGERYLAGGVNVSLLELFSLIARVAHRRAPRVRVPYALAVVIGGIDGVRCRLLGGTPRVPLEGVRMGREHMYVSSEKAQHELGYTSSPIQPAIERAVAWFRDHGYAA